MTGSAFIIHNDTWSCSNEVTLDIHNTPIIEGGKYSGRVREEKTLKVNGIFNATEPLKQGDKCEFVILNEDTNEKYSFFAQAKAVGQKQVILNIFSKSNRISEILSNITFKK